MLWNLKTVIEIRDERLSKMMTDMRRKQAWDISRQLIFDHRSSWISIATFSDSI